MQKLSSKKSNIVLSQRNSATILFCFVFDGSSDMQCDGCPWTSRHTVVLSHACQVKHFTSSASTHSHQHRHGKLQVILRQKSHWTLPQGAETFHSKGTQQNKKQTNRQRFSSIVGPNGSGKSNVLDALLFVFGRRASKIRSKNIGELVHHSEKHTNAQQTKVTVNFEQIIDDVNVLSLPSLLLHFFIYRSLSRVI